jgi:hypothetical protein
MNFDLRTPIGWMFTLTGLILSLFGWSVKDDASFLAKSQGINANLYWGLTLLVFGLLLMLFGKKGVGSRE